MRPWQSAEDIITSQETDQKLNFQKSSETVLPPEIQSLFDRAEKIKNYGLSHLPPEVTQFLERAEEIKNYSLAHLPPEFSKYLEASWLFKLKLYPKLRLPVPGFLVHKEKK